MPVYQTLYCHGWSSGPAVWNHIAEAPVSAPTFRETDGASKFYPALINVIPDQPHIVVAWSMGGMLAQAYAATRPNLLKGLVLVGSTPKFTSMDRKKGWPRKIVQQMVRSLKADPVKTVREFQMGMFSPEERPALKSYRAAFADLGAGDFSESALVAGLEYLMETDLTGMLDKINCPTVWIHGSADAVCPVGCLEAVPDRHKKVILDGCGHVPHWSRADDVGTLIREFTDAL